MKPTTFSCLLAALFSAASVLAEVLQAPAGTAIVEPSQQTVAPALVDDEQAKLEPRQGAPVTAAVTTLAADAAQYPSITTQWLPSQIGTTDTYVEQIYTQTFAAVPEQWPSAGTGEIGYGTLTKHGKRAAPVETGIAGRIRKP